MKLTSYAETDSGQWTYLWQWKSNCWNLLLVMKKYGEQNTNFIALAMKQVCDEKVGDERYSDERPPHCQQQHI